MMRNKKICLLIILMMMGWAPMAMLAQSDTSKAFHPTGSPIVTIFGNLHFEFTHPQHSGFELERAYWGYQGQLTSELTAKVVVDMGKSSNVDDLQRLVYLKNAYLTWTRNKFKLSVGLVGMQQFSTQEKLWGHRYLYKSFQDEYKFGSSADLGLVAEYKFAPFCSADVTVVNGDGYKKVRLNPYFLYGLGLTFNPVKPLTLRVYGSYKDCDHSDTLLAGQGNLTGFVAYKVDRVSVGVEYAMMWNAGNTAHKHQQGLSAFASVNLPKQCELYARWDCLMTNGDVLLLKEQVGILGFQYAPNKHLRFSPNVRVKAPNGGNVAVAGYLSMEVKL